MPTNTANTPIATLPDLLAHLRAAEAAFVPLVRCTLAPSLAARVTEARLRAAFDAALPFVQARTWHLSRHRDGSVTLISHLTYRDSLRMLAGTLPIPPTAIALADALRRIPDERTRFLCLYEIVCRSVVYSHTAPGAKGYSLLVGAAGVLGAGVANCQGFADVMLLLGHLAGLTMGIRISPGMRALHAVSTVCIGGVLYQSDASRGARALREEGAPAMWRTCMMQCIQEKPPSAPDFFHDLARK